jgi:hypothetical protein
VDLPRACCLSTIAAASGSGRSLKVWHGVRWEDGGIHHRWPHLILLGTLARPDRHPNSIYGSPSQTIWIGSLNWPSQDALSIAGRQHALASTVHAYATLRLVVAARRSRGLPGSKTTTASPSGRAPERWLHATVILGLGDVLDRLLDRSTNILPSTPVLGR